MWTDLDTEGERALLGPPIFDLDAITVVPYEGDVELLGVGTCKRCSELATVSSVLRRSTVKEIANDWMLERCPQCEHRDAERNEKVASVSLDVEAKSITVVFKCDNGHTWENTSSLHPDNLQEFTTAPSA